MISGENLDASFVVKHHMCHKERSFPIPLKRIDVVRRTDTTLDVQQACLTDDCWTVNGDWILSGHWTDVTQFTFFLPPTKRIHVVWGERDKDPSDVQARDYVARCDVRQSKEILAKRKIQWAEGQSQGSGAARKLRGMYCVNLDDEEFNETLKNARKKLGSAKMDSGTPCV